MGEVGPPPGSSCEWDASFALFVSGGDRIFSLCKPLEQARVALIQRTGDGLASEHIADVS